MPKLSLSHAWEETKLVLAADGRLFVSVALALLVLPQTIAGLIAPRSPTEAEGLTLSLFALLFLIGLVAEIALNRLAIGPSVTVGQAIGRGLMRMPVLLGSMLIVLVGLFLVLIPLVLIFGAVGLMQTQWVGQEAPPSLIALILLISVAIYPVLQLTGPTAAMEKGGSIYLLRRAWQLSRGAYWRLLAFVAVLLLGFLVVALASQLGVGSIIAGTLGPPEPLSISALVLSLIVSLIQAAFAVLFGVMLARIYAQLSGGAQAQPSVPSSGT